MMNLGVCTAVLKLNLSNMADETGIIVQNVCGAFMLT